MYVTNVNSANGTGGLSAYSIGTNGSLTELSGSPYATGTAGTPEFIAISPNGYYLYVTNYGSTNGSGGLSAYAIGAGGTLTAISGSPFATGSVGSPQGIAITPDSSYLYVTNFGSTTGTGGVTAYTVGPNGALAQIGTYPTSSAGGPEVVTISPNGSYLYVTNAGSANGAAGLSAYTIASSGSLAPVAGSPFLTGTVGSPAGLAVSPDGSYLYVANIGSPGGNSGLSAYSIGSGGTLTSITSGTLQTGTKGGPAIIAITP